MSVPRPLLLGVVLAAALWVRLDRLGAPSFDIDEYLHVYAAQSVNATGQPTLPSGNQYNRALPYTWLVAQSFRLFGVSEFSARLPSTLLDVAVLALVYLIARSWFGAGTGLAAVGLLAFAPWWVLAAKNCRMYPLFHLLYMLCAWSAWQAFEGDRSAWRRWGWAMVALGSGALAMWIHQLAITLAVSVGVFVLGRAIATRQGRYALVVLAGVGLMGAVGVSGVINLQAVLQSLWSTANSAPNWAAGARYDWGYYARHWWGLYPGFMLLYPMGLWQVWRQRPALGWFFVCLGLVPFALHSLVFDWKMVRYAVYLLPWLILPAAMTLVRALAWLWTRRAAWAKGVAVAAVLAAMHPWAVQALASAPKFPSPPWRDVYAQVRPSVREEDAVLTSMPLATLYYLRRPASYVMNNVHIQNAGYRATKRSSPEGLLVDGYGGRPMVTTLDELRRVVGRHPRGWILIDRLRFAGSTLTPEMTAFITGQMQFVPMDSSPAAVNPVTVYRWDETLHQTLANGAPALASADEAS